ncbi:MAG: helix-turn-helix transcriptional regulator [Bacteroidota bacterium]
MSKQGIFKCYQIIIERISRRPGINFNQLSEFLHEEGFEVSVRTLQRYIEQIRTEFSVEIKYNPKDKGYYIENLEGPNMNIFLRLLSINDTAGVLMDSIKSGKNTMQYVQMENAGLFEGSEHIKSVLEAIKKFKTICITHQSFDSNQPKKYILEPYLIKEYRGRWYVWGKLEGKKEFRTFGFDRILSLEVNAKKFERDKKIDPAGVFSDTIGIIYTKESPKEVILHFNQFMGKYIQRLPLHHSQKLLSENAKGFIFSFFVSINPELKSIILSYADAVKVIEPKSLVKDIAVIHKKAAKLYQ